MIAALSLRIFSAYLFSTGNVSRFALMSHWRRMEWMPNKDLEHRSHDCRASVNPFSAPSHLRLLLSRLVLANTVTIGCLLCVKLCDNRGKALVL